MAKKEKATERLALAYYLEPLVENPWIAGYIPASICRELEKAGLLDPESFLVTPKGRSFLVGEGYLKTAYKRPSLKLVT